MAYGLSCSAACGIFLDQGLNLCPELNLAGGFLNTVPPGKSPKFMLLRWGDYLVLSEESGSKEDVSTEYAYFG